MASFTSVQKTFPERGGPGSEAWQDLEPGGLKSRRPNSGRADPGRRDSGRFEPGLPSACSFPLSPSALAHRDGQDLARMIESEIIPRLMLAHRPDAAAAAVGPRTLDAFVRMAVSCEADILTEFVQSLVAGGLPLEQLYVDLLIPTARRLGDDWVEDDISFTDVTIGLNRLQQVVRNLGWRVQPPAGDGAGAIYLAPCTKEQHTFGLVLLEDGFRRAGWRTSLDVAATSASAAARVREDWFDVFGVSAACGAPVAKVAAMVAAVRRASRNPGLFVLVGGGLFLDDPRLVDAVGGDATAATGADALLIAGEAVRPVAFG